MEYNFNSIVRFKSNKPYKAKKTITILIILGLFIYFCKEIGIFMVAFEVAFMYFFMFRKYIKNNGGFVKGMKSFYKNMYKSYNIDILDTCLSIEEDKITIDIKNSEYFSFQSIDTIYTINKNDIREILIGKSDNSVMICFYQTDIELKGSKKIDKKYSLKEEDSLLFYIKNEDMINEIENSLIENKYQIVLMDETLKYGNIIDKVKKAKVRLKKKKEKEASFEKTYKKIMGRK